MDRIRHCRRWYLPRRGWNVVRIQESVEEQGREAGENKSQLRGPREGDEGKWILGMTSPPLFIIGPHVL